MNNLAVNFEKNLGENYCLIFLLDGKSYGINVDNVLEIIKIPKMDIPQKMPKHILGVITYNNISVKVVDLFSILAHSAHTYSIDSQVVILRTEESIFGILTDKVIDVKTIRESNIRALPYHSEENLVQYLYRIKDDFVSVLDLNSIQNVVQKTQFELGDTDITSILPLGEEYKEKLNTRRFDLMKKFEYSIEQIYYDQEQYIIFDLNDNLYSLPIKHIKEIVNYKNVSIVQLPAKYDYVEGIFNLRGDFISVLNFKKFLEMSNSTEISDTGMLIVLELKDFKIALLVDKIIDIVTVTPNDVVNKFDSKFESKYVLSELHIQNKIISIISVDRLLADERLYIKD